MRSFSAIISSLGGAAALARKLGEKDVTVRAWALRESVPSAYWVQIEEIARELGQIDITVTSLAVLKARRATRTNQESAA